MSDKPLVLDVDGTFLATDMLVESFWAGLGRAPGATLQAVARHWRDRSRLKGALAEIGQPRVDLMPVTEGLGPLVAEARAAGREVILASASDISLVRPLAAHHRLSNRVFASEGGVNLKAGAKAEALVAAFGEGGFDYAGNEAADRAVWDRADGRIVVGSADLAASVHGAVHVATPSPVRGLIKAMRPHQWVKNVLLFLPVIAAHEFGLGPWLAVLLGILAFSAAASCIYLVNDLLDLEADRLHRTKCRRPFASGRASLTSGMALCAALALVALGVGAVLGPAFLGVVVLYMALSLAYSLRLKRMRWIDIACLAALYTLRVVAGAAASGVEASGFMLVFIFPIFLTLGCVKRLTELTLAEGDARLPGRGYGRADRPDLLNVACLGVVGALVIFFLYSLSPQAAALYPDRWLLWLALVPIAWWLMRMVRLGWYGKQDYDPIVFALRDLRGVGLLLITLALMFWGAGIWSDWWALLTGA